ncbi:hypothetical protein CYMTET_28282 [Cymbomonas tetramitiformis]|uniref:Uncharacterized protein n=1 Tax=Cymbomonas tetramitiformis TaxID=36881 RepID=A0AAE0FN83_9CHLO|nr:hypothetical protein CYMTET_28282 [Cymbomonas tetramitiformis]
MTAEAGLQMIEAPPNDEQARAAPEPDATPVDANDSDGETALRLQDLAITKMPTTLHRVAVMTQLQLDKPWAAGHGKKESAWEESVALIMCYDAYKGMEPRERAKVVFGGKYLQKHAKAMCDTYKRQVARHPRESGVEEEHDELANLVEAVLEVWTEFDSAKDATAAEAAAKKRLEKEEDLTVSLGRFLEREGQTKRQKIELEMQRFELEKERWVEDKQDRRANREQTLALANVMSKLADKLA